MTATAVSISLVTLKEAGLAASRAATGIMTSAVLDDIGSLALVAIMVPILKAGDEGIGAVEIIIILIKAIGFFVLVGLTSKFLFSERIRLNWCGKSNKFYYKYGYRHLVRQSPSQSILCVLLTGLLFGLLALQLGFHPGIGAYMGALILKDGYFTDVFDKEPLRVKSFLNHHPTPTGVPQPEHHHRSFHRPSITDITHAVSHAMDGIAHRRGSYSHPSHSSGAHGGGHDHSDGEHKDNHQPNHQQHRHSITDLAHTVAHAVESLTHRHHRTSR